MASSKKQGMKRRGKLAKAKKEVDKTIIKSMANSMRIQILTILNERANSSTRMAKELGVEFNEVNYEVEALRKMGRIEVVEEVKRRGAVEVFYRAVSRAMLDAYEWPAVPQAIKGDLRASLLQTLTDDAIAAIAEEMYDSFGPDEALKDAHMSWTPMIVDERGWNDVMAILERALMEVIDVHNRCAESLAAEDSPGISCTVSILGYPSAHDRQKIGPPIEVKDLATSFERQKQESEKKAASKKSSSRKRPTSRPAQKAKRNGPRKADRPGSLTK
jgi:biotin operon repressor